MQLEHTFSVPADLDTVWQAVLDPERVAPCMPGASLTEVDGSTFAGTVKVKVGPISLLYKGTGEFLETDEQARRVVIKASGKDSRGNGTAAATVTLSLRADGSSTAGTVVTDLSITGKPAQFGRGLISEVGGKILDSFATCLTAKLATRPPVVEEPAVEQPVAAKARPAAKPKAAGAATSASAGTGAPAAEAERPQLSVVEPSGDDLSAGNGVPKPKLVSVQPRLEAEPIDLMAFAGPSLAKRVVPLLAGLLVLLVAVALRRRSR